MATVSLSVYVGIFGRTSWVHPVSFLKAQVWAGFRFVFKSIATLLSFYTQVLLFVCYAYNFLPVYWCLSH